MACEWMLPHMEGRETFSHPFTVPSNSPKVPFRKVLEMVQWVPGEISVNSFPSLLPSGACTGLKALL